MEKEVVLNKINEKNNLKQNFKSQKNSETNKSIRNKIVQKKTTPTYVYALGGLGEVGKNMYVVEQGNEIWIMDSGIKFSSEISIEGIIPSFEWLEKNNKKIKGLIITHGHEDHIGSVPHLLSVVKIPKIYAGRIAANLIFSKIHEKGLPKHKIEIINNNSKIKSLNFTIEFFNVNHSIPDCYGIVFKSKNGVIVNTADFKFDLSPVGVKADLYKMAKFGVDGVDLLLSDSTNAGSEKFSLSESEVSKNIDIIVKKSKGRVIISTFASNVFRVREIIKIAIKHNRKIVVFGYSMDKIVNISRKIKYINVTDKNFIQPKEIKNFKDKDLLIISTGTQGEKMAALSKMADGRHKEIKIRKEDTVIFASSAIPGNFEAVEKVTNELVKKGCKIYNNKNNPGVHASGHGGKQEQLLMFNLLKPKYFFPVHGETVMQLQHSKTAIESGVNKNNIFILSNGERLKLEKGKVSQHTSVPAENIYVDDTNLKGQSIKVISDRENLSNYGVAILNIIINSNKNKIVTMPEIKTFGIINESKNRGFLEKVCVSVKYNLEDYYKNSNKISFNGIKELIKNTIETEFKKKKGISPIVIPIILNKE